MGDVSKKLIKLLEMTASEHDGEALNAMRMANALMKKHGLQWNKIITEIESRPTAKFTRQDFQESSVFDMMAAAQARQAAEMHAFFQQHSIAAILTLLESIVIHPKLVPVDRTRLYGIIARLRTQRVIDMQDYAWFLGIKERLGV